MREQIRHAHDRGIKGVIGIHWRTKDIRENFDSFAHFASHPKSAKQVRDFYAAPTAALMERADIEGWFEGMKSPEYLPYDPSWGRIAKDLRPRIEEGAKAIPAWRSTLLLDDVSAALEPAWNLRDQTRLGKSVTHAQIGAAAAALDRAPIRELFETYSRRLRSPGELGVLSSLNQRPFPACVAVPHTGQRQR